MRNFLPTHTLLCSLQGFARGLRGGGSHALLTGLTERNTRVAGCEAAGCQSGLPASRSDCFWLLIATPAGAEDPAYYGTRIHNPNNMAAGSPATPHAQLPSPLPPIQLFCSLFFFFLTLLPSCKIRLANSDLGILLRPHSFKHLQRL